MSTFCEALTAHFELERAIRERLAEAGLPQRWRVAPLDDLRDHWWLVDGDKLLYLDVEPTVETAAAWFEKHYSAEVRGDVVARAEGLAFTEIDTNTDMNIFTTILDCAREVTDPALVAALLGCDDDSE